MDQSFLDDKYFIDEHIYNCPFCNRRHVSYYVTGRFDFDWTINKKCSAYLVWCASCGYESMHLSFTNVFLYHAGHENVKGRNIRVYRFNFQTSEPDVDDEDELEDVVAEPPQVDIDELFFYSVPTSFFVIDKRIPKVLRELVTEAEGCLKSNFLTGASACVRKAVYELAVKEKANGENYDERLKSLKEQKPEVDPAYFDTLLTIQQVTSSKVHELSYDGWDAKHLRLILSSLLEILREIYVVPEVRREKREAIVQLKREVLGENPTPDGEG